MIKQRISDRLSFVLSLMKESKESEESGNTYHAACLAASARDSLTVLHDLVNGMACALRAEGYCDAYFSDIARRVARSLDLTVVRLEKLETSLKG